nr:hypothetical protein HAGR004_40910 [Bdellovibrio sp. HAGR004]
MSCKDDDVIIFSDLDEIPRPEKIVEYKDRPGIKTFYQEMYYYYLNNLVVTHPEPNEMYKGYIPWHGSVMANYRYFKKSPNDMRTYRSKRDSEHIMVMDGGWHYSFMGGTKMILKKLRAYSHTEYMHSKTITPEWVEQQVREGKDIFSRNMSFRTVDLASHAPQYIVENREKFEHFIV